MHRTGARHALTHATSCRLGRPAGNLEIVIEAMKNRDGEAVSVAPGSGHLMRIALPPGCEGAFVARYV